MSNTYNLSALISYYELCNRAEGKSPKTITWYSANLKRFHSYFKNRHLPDLIENIDIKLLREYIFHLLKRNKYELHPYTPVKNEPLSTSMVQAPNFIGDSIVKQSGLSCNVLSDCSVL